MSNNGISIDRNNCIKDGACISVCPCGIFRPTESGYPDINSEAAITCIKCGHCASICPGKAIKIEELLPANYQQIQANTPSATVLANLIKSRRSIRNFKDTLVEPEKLKSILEITRYCPTAKNTQNLSWIVVNGREKVQQLSSTVIDTFRNNERMTPVVNEFDQGKDPIHRGAPQVIVCYGPEKYPWGTMDAAVAIANLELVAKAEGLGTCWGGFSTWAASTSKDVGKSIGLDESQKIFAVLMIGYAKFPYRLVPPRKPLNLKFL